MKWWAATAVALGLLANGSLRAQDDAIKLGSDAPEHTHERAGCPLDISRCAAPSNTPDYFGYYVGGGRVCGGYAPGPADGTYGWDYAGPLCYTAKIVLCWGAGCQGGTGSYSTTKGPEVPNPLACHLPERPRTGWDCHHDCEGDHPVKEGRGHALFRHNDP